MKLQYTLVKQYGFSFISLPAVGFKAQHTDVGYSVQLFNREHYTISQPIVSVTYNTEQDQGTTTTTATVAIATNIFFI